MAQLTVEKQAELFEELFCAGVSEYDFDWGSVYEYVEENFKGRIAQDKFDKWFEFMKGAYLCL